MRLLLEEVIKEYLTYSLEFSDKFYRNNKYRHKVRCLVCGKISKKSLSEIRRGRNPCPYCANTYRETPEEIEELLTRNSIRILVRPDNLKKRYPAECLVCHHKFEVNPSYTKNRGYGCPKCAKKTLRSLSEVKEQVIQEGYIYHEGGEGSYEDLVITCPNGHTYTTNVHNFLNKGRRCRSCTDTGFNTSKPAIFYYLRVEHPDLNSPLYKIGITNRTVQDRFSNTDLSKITVLRELYFESGQSAYDLEQYYLNIFSEHKYCGDPVLETGNTELFHTDLFRLDN